MFQLRLLKTTAGKNSQGDVMHARAECRLSIDAAWVLCVDREHLLCGDKAAPQPQACLWELEEESGQAQDEKKMRNRAEKDK